MKKLFFIIVTVLCLSACNKNKEVYITYNANLTVFAKDVIDGYLEFYNGDFDFNTSNKLRISLFVYNENGDFLMEKNQLVRNYDETANFSLNLENGVYKIIAASDVLKNGDTPYYTFNHGASINYFNVENTSNYIGYMNELLGLVCYELNINNNPVEKNIKVQKASLVFYSYMAGIHTFTDVDEYLLCARDKTKMMSYNNGEFVSSVNGSGYTYYLDRTSPDDYSSPNVYGCRAMLPVNNLEFFVSAHNTAGEEIGTFGDGKKTFEIGKQYMFYISIPDLQVLVYDWEDLPKVVADPNADKNFVEYLIDNNFVENSIAE